MAELENEVIAELAEAAQKPVTLEAGKLYAWRKPDGSIHERDLRGDSPAFRAGVTTVRDVAGFAHYYDKHADDWTEVFADLDTASVTAVLDAHGDAEIGPRWQQHRLTLLLRLTQPWQTWLEHDRKFLPQQAFAEFLEDNYADLDPRGTVKAADFLEVAQSFQAATKVEFASGTRLTSGETELTYKETTGATAGRAHKLAIPTEFDLAIAPYEDCDDATIAARFRYRIRDGQLALGYFLNQPERVRQDAVKAIIAKAADATLATIMLGRPSA